MSSRAPALFALVALLAMAEARNAPAQEHPNQARGIRPETAFSTGGIDTVNGMNGGLSLSIPLGQSYPMNGGWSYSFGLSYSSNFWKYNSVAQNSACGGGTAIEAIIDPLFNAGTGWYFGMGRLFSPTDTEFNESGKWIYVNQSGGRHTFYDTLHEDETPSGGCGGSLGCYWQYTRDNSYLRLDRVNRIVELPSGLRQTFNTSGDLTRMEDRFGNDVRVAYSTSGSMKTWTIDDSLGRHHTAVFEVLSEGRGTHLKSLSLRVFGGGTATYSLTYDEGTTAIARTDKDTSCVNNSPANATGSDWISAALLKEVTGPEGLVWSMLKPNGEADYFRPPSNPYTRSIYSGVIMSLQFPTGGRLAWTWRTWVFPAGKNGFRDTSAGVASKTVSDPYGYEPSGAWTYESELCPLPQAGTLCDVIGERPNEVISYIRSPTGTRFYQQFAANTDDGTPNGTAGRENANWDYGLPYSCREEIQPSGSRKCLSTTIYSPGPNSTRQRSNWVRFIRDPLPEVTGDPGPGTFWNRNRRTDFHRLKFDDDGDDRHQDVAFSSFDGLGHFRVTTETARFTTTTWRESKTNFNRASGCYDVDPTTFALTCTGGNAFDPPATGTAWLLGIFDYTSVNHAGGFEKKEFSFDGRTGFLDCYRVLEGSVNGWTRGPRDIFVDLDPSVSAPGHVARERWYGGDGASLSTAAGCIDAGTSTYQIDHSYAGGVLASSRHVGSGISHYDYDATIDTHSGLPSAVEDPAGYRTTLTFDSLGRATSIAPVGAAGSSTDDGAATVISYSFPNSQHKTRVTWARTCPAAQSDCGELLPQGESYFDGFGRLLQERAVAPAGWSNRYADYNIQGWKLRDSEWTPDGSTVYYTQYQSFDPLGRARRIVAPDGKETNLTFYGERQLDRKVFVATDLSGAETEQTTTYIWDGFGRLRSVTEPSGASNANITTSYGYDVGSRLAEMSTPTGAGGGAQVRKLKYDNRGFLQYELAPEKAAPFDANPDPQVQDFYSVAYLYDARGNPTSIQDGGTSDWLKLTYDKAERLKQVKDGARADQRLLKQFTYDTGSSGFALSKLTKAERYNYFDHISMIALVSQQFAYQGVEGRPSSRATSIAYNGASGESFSQSFAWSRNGELVSQTYPNCSAGGCPAGGQTARSMSNAFSRGFLTGVSYNGSSVAGLSYHPNGMLSQALHENSTQASQKTKMALGLDPKNMQRIGSLSYYTGSTLIADFGTFSYDGSGNLERQTMSTGSSKFKYDGVSRLLEAEFGFGGGPYRQSYTYDRFGNIGSITTQVAAGPPTTVNTPSALATNRLSSGYYDGAGNMTSYLTATQEYWYDAFGLTTRVKKGSEEWLFVYSADDERLLSDRVPSGGFTFTLRGLGGEVLRETPVHISGATYTDYVYGAGLLAKFESSATRTDYHVDHLGSPRLAVNGSGAITRYYMYYPYGQEYNAPAQADTFRLRFTGHERDLLNTASAADDSESHHARRFSLLTARYQSPDPLGGDLLAPQSLNLFSYVGGNPMNRIDPFGLDYICGYTKGEDENGKEIDLPKWCNDITTVGKDPGRPPVGGGGGGGGGPKTGFDEGERREAHERERRQICRAPAGPTDLLRLNVRALSAARWISDGALSPMLVSTVGFLSLPHAPWDFKRTFNNRRRLEDFGNFHFGAAMAAAGLPLSLTVRGGGIANMISGDAKLLEVLGSAPYGDDDDNDVAWVTAGWVYQKECN